jgi:dynein heavy chain, axonemal
MSPRTFKARVVKLIEELTFVCYSYARRGTFERHKIILSALLTLRILLRSGELHQNEVDHLVIGKMDLNPGSIPESLRSFLTESIWASV